MNHRFSDEQIKYLDELSERHPKESIYWNVSDDYRLPLFMTKSTLIDCVTNEFCPCRDKNLELAIADCLRHGVLAINATKLIEAHRRPAQWVAKVNN